MQHSPLKKSFMVHLKAYFEAPLILDEILWRTSKHDGDNKNVISNSCLILIIMMTCQLKDQVFKNCIFL